MFFRLTAKTHDLIVRIVEMIIKNHLADKSYIEYHGIGHAGIKAHFIANGIITGKKEARQRDENQRQ